MPKKLLYLFSIMTLSIKLFSIGPPPTKIWTSFSLEKSKVIEQLEADRDMEVFSVYLNKEGYTGSSGSYQKFHIKTLTLGLVVCDSRYLYIRTTTGQKIKVDRFTYSDHKTRIYYGGTSTLINAKLVSVNTDKSDKITIHDLYEAMKNYSIFSTGSTKSIELPRSGPGGNIFRTLKSDNLMYYSKYQSTELVFFTNKNPYILEETKLWGKTIDSKIVPEAYAQTEYKIIDTTAPTANVDQKNNDYTGYILTASNTSDGAGIGVKSYKWVVRDRNKQIVRTISNVKTITTNQNEAVAEFYVTDHFNKESPPYKNNVFIDLTPPKLGLPSIPNHVNGKITLTASPSYRNEEQVCYWTINNNKQPNNIKTLELTPENMNPGDNTVTFYAQDKSGADASSTHTIFYDNVKPSIATPEFKEYRVVDGVFNAVFTWKEGSDPDGSGLKYSKLFHNSEETNTAPGEYSVPFDSAIEEIILITRAEDNAGNITEDNLHTLKYRFPAGMQFDNGQYPADELRPEVNNGKITYPVKLPLTFGISNDFNSALTSNSANNISYEITATVGGVTTTDVISTADLIPHNTSNSVMYYPYSVKGASGESLAGQSVTYKVRTVYGNSVVLTENTLPAKTLSKVGSIPNINIPGGGQFFNREPNVLLVEKDSVLGTDLDGNEITYKIMYRKPGAAGFIESSTVHDLASPEVKLLDRDGANIFVDNGIYELKVVAGYTNTGLGSNTFESNVLSINFDKAPPSKPVISFSTGADKLTKDSIDFRVENLLDTGDAGVSHLLIWKQVEGQEGTLPVKYDIGEGFDTLDITALGFPGVVSGERKNVSLFVKSVDRAGNESEVTTEVIDVDKEIPVISNADYICTESSIKFSWNCIDQTELQLNNGEWVKSVDKTLFVENLGHNEKQILDLRVKDAAGNISGQVRITGYTLDVIEPIVQEDIKQEVNNGSRYIYFSFPTTEEKALRYSIIRVVDGIETPLTGSYANGRVRFEYEYTEKKRHDFIVRIANGGGIFNKDKELTFSFTPANNEPLFTNGELTTPVNNGYASITGLLEWPGAIEYDSDDALLKYIVTITPEGGSTIVYDPVNPLTENRILLSTLLGSELKNNVNYRWSVTANDGYENSLPISEKVFRVDDNSPVVNITNIKTDDYTKSLSFNITDSVSGLGSVELFLNNNPFTDYSVNGDDYILDLSLLSSGKHTVKVDAADSVGNIKTELMDIHYDGLIPGIMGEIKPELKSSAAEYLSPDRRFNVSFDIKDDYSGVEDIYYGFAPDSTSEPLEWFSANDNGRIYNTGDRRVPVSVPVNWNGADGESTYILFKVGDKAGNESIISRTSKTVYIDSTAPAMESIGLTGLITNNHRSYLKSINDLTVNALFKDSEELLDINNYRYTLRSDNSEVILKDLDTSTYSPVSLEEGNSYTIEVTAVNRTGKSLTAVAGNFIYDSQSPVNQNVVVDNSESYTVGNNLKIDLEADERGSGIVLSEIKIGSSDGLSDIGNETLSHGWKINGIKYSNSLDFVLPETIVNGDYFITASFIDGVGNSVTSKAGFRVDNSIPKLTVYTEPYTSSESGNSAVWSFSRSDLISKVYYRLSGETLWTEVTYPDSGNIIDFNNVLNNGASNYIEVKVLTTDTREFVSRSNIFVYDSTDPVDLLSDSESWPEYIKAGELQVNWNVKDDESGISEIRHKVEILRGAVWENLTVWITESQLKENGVRYFSGLGLKQSDKIRVRRVIRNGVGATAERLSSVITVDNTVPDRLSNVITNASYLKTSAVPKANWMNTDSDSESGMKYYWAFTKDITDKENITGWNEDNGSHRAVVDIPSLTVKPVNGETWYFVVKGVNGAGMDTYGSSYGVTFDDMAPELLEVTLTDGQSAEHIYYLNGQQNLTVNVNASDQSGSNLEYSSDFGYLNNLGDYTLLSGSRVYSGTEKKYRVLPSHKELIVNSNKLVLFRADATDEAGNTNSLAYSPGTVFDNTDPVVINHSYYISNGKLFVNWDSTEGGTPIKEYRLNMKLGSTSISLPDSGIVTNKNTAIDVTAFNDGIYTLYIEAVSESGLTSEKAVISDILIDNNKPLVSSINISNYVYRDLKPEISLVETGSGITEYQYSIGTTADSGSVTNGWISVESTVPEIFKPVINLMDYTDGYNNTANGDTIYISFMAKDRAGNWSAVVKSPGIILDKTPAENLSIATPELSNNRDRIEAIIIKGTDNISGLENIELTLFKIENGTPIESGTMTESIKTSTIIKEIDITDFIYKKDNLELLDNGIYRIGYRLGNGTGVYSPMVYSNDFRVDLTMPQIIFTADELVFNDNLLPVSYTLSEDMKLEFELVKDLEVRDSIVIGNAVQGIHEYIFDHKYIDEELAYGNYTLRATLTDSAGNVTTYENAAANVKDIRYNEPPRITFDSSDFKTTPGRPYKVTPLSVVDNDDDNSLLAYSWTFETTGNSNVSGSTDSNPVVKFYHGDNTSTSTRYRVVLTVTDPYGKSATEDHYVTVENTRAGELYHNEFWIGTHYIDGDITIPPDITVTIEPAAKVEVSGEYGIYVNGNLNVSSGSALTYTGVPESYWSGISVNSGGSAVIDNSNISRALRGVAVINSGSLNMTDTTIENNVIGVHAFNSSPVLTNCVITGNSAYGLKEDGVSTPILNNTSITGNTLNIYDSVNTIELGESR